MRLTRVQTTAPSSDTQTYTLDALGNRIAHSRISSAWTYDANNRLTQRGSGAGATSYQYDNAGNLTQKTEAGATTTYRYDTQNRLIEVALAQAGAIEQVIARYGYDPQDRRIWKEQYASKSGEPLFMAQRTLYLYSDQGLLAEATQPFVLDPRLTATTVDAPQPGVIASPGPVITGPLPMVVGASGVSAAPMIAGSGVVSGAVGSTSSNSAIRMASVPAAVPVAIQAASASPRALSADGGEAINIGPAAPAITTQYGLRPGSPWGTSPLFIQTKNSAGQTSMAYYHHDQLGTPLQATDKAGNIVWAASFDAFGRASITTPQATIDKPTIASNLRLPGQYEDVETELHYNWHRYYDAEVGRYVTADPIGLAGGINFYTYVKGNPVSFIDEIGLSPGPASPNIGSPNSRGPDICSGNDCITPPYDTPPKTPKKDPKAYSCAEKTFSLGACLACCGARSPAQYLASKEQGSICAEKCYHKAGITKAPQSVPLACLADQ